VSLLKTYSDKDRFPDSGAYSSWVALQAKIQAAAAQPGFSASGTLSFISGWQTALTNKPLQISQQDMTGFKEAHDLGYQLRARYPSFYQDGNDYMVWANKYATPINESRVVQTAKAFLQGYLYVFAETYGTIVAVNSTGAAGALGDSLAPADLCPAFTNNNGNNVTDCD
jgi:acid phosphatase